VKRIRSNGTLRYPTVASLLDTEESHRTLKRKVEMLLACWEISVGGKPKVAKLLGYRENPHRHLVSSSRKPYSSIWALLLGCGRKAIYSVQIILPSHATLGETPYYDLWYHRWSLHSGNTQRIVMVRLMEKTQIMSRQMAVQTTWKVTLVLCSRCSLYLVI